MCGIAGYIGAKKINNKVINSTLNIMKNRGPDNQDFFFEKKKIFIVTINTFYHLDFQLLMRLKDQINLL